jgi:septal ring factor EnvC (AmiA/AmiB activator)
MNLNFLAKFKAKSKEELLRQLDNEITYTKAKIEHNKREIAKLEQEIKEDGERLSVLQEVVRAIQEAEHVALNYEFRAYNDGAEQFIILRIEDGTTVVIPPRLMDKIASDWSET